MSRLVKTLFIVSKLRNALTSRDILLGHMCRLALLRGGWKALVSHDLVASFIILRRSGRLCQQVPALTRSRLLEGRMRITLSCGVM